MKILSAEKKKWWVLIGVGIASFLGCIDFTIVNTALPAIQMSLHATVSELQWIINIFILALSTCMVIMGRLADIYGRRLVLYIGMIVFGLSSLGSGLAPTIEWLIFFRLIQGLSCAILYTASGAIVSQAFPPEEKGKAIGTLFGINGIGLAIGPVLGGIIISVLSWRFIFLLNVPLILLSLWICFLSVAESRNEQMSKSIDWYGLITLVIALPCFILGMIKGEEWGWGSALTMGLFIISVCGFILFYYIENKVSSPIIEFHLFANPTFIASIVATFALAFFYCLAFFFMPLYLHMIRDENSFTIGMMLLPTTAMVALFSPIIGRMVDQLGPKLLLLCGFGFFVLSAFLQTLFTVDTSLIHIIVAFLLMGIGWACVLGPSTVASLSSVPEYMGAVAMGTAWTLHNIGGAIGLALGIATYRVYAQKDLLNELVKMSIAKGAWIKKAVANPEEGVQLLQRYAGLAKDQAASLFKHSFIAGYQGAMWLLVISSFLSLLFVLLMMKKNRKQVSL